MNIRPFSQWTIYRHRQFISYMFLAVFTVLLIAMCPAKVPPGLSAAEQQSVVTSHSIVFTQLPTQIIDLPYHILQKFSVQLFDVTPLGVRLPSMLIGALTALFIFLILHRWFLLNVAVFAGLIIISSTWFLSMARLGTPLIMIPFWTSLLILAATYISQLSKRRHQWKMVFAFAAALSFYTPYMTYLFAAALFAAIAQPHLRYLIRISSKFVLGLGAFLFILLLVPLGWGIYQNVHVLRELLAIPAALPEPLQFASNISQAVSNFVNPYNINFGDMITPALTLTSAVLMLLGGVRLLHDFHSVRAHVLLIWAALLVPVIGFSPDNLAVLFIPAMLVVAIGLQLVIRYWYKLFPLNPYARIFGLLPLAALLFTTVQFNYERYFYGMLYSPQAASTFKEDAFLAQAELKRQPASAAATFIVAEQDRPLYRVMASNRPNTIIWEPGVIPPAGPWLVAESQVPLIAPQFPTGPSKLLVNDRKQNALLFRLYQR